MEDKRIESAFKLMGTILGGIIAVAGLVTLAYGIIYPSFTGLIFFGSVGAVIGVFIVYAARRYA